MKRPLKWIITLIGIVAFLSFGGLLPGEPLVDRAMVVGFGVDLTEEGELNVSAQILNPSPAAQQQGIGAKVVTSRHETISGAMTYISEKSGKTVALTHCNVVLIGENVAKSQYFYSVLNYLITNSYLSENAFVFVTEGKAEELLNSNTGFGGNASFYVQRLVGMYGDYNNVANKTLQRFVVDYHQLGQANWLPLIKTEPTNPDVSAGGDQSSTDKQILFDINSVMIFKENDFVAEYGSEGTEAINYVMNKVSKGNVETIGDNNEKIVMYIIDKQHYYKYDLDAKTVKIRIEISTLLKEIIDYSGEDKYIDRTSLTEAEIARAEKSIADNILSFYTEMQSYDVDIFSFYEGFYSKFGNKALNMHIKDIALEIEVEVKANDV